MNKKRSIIVTIALLFYITVTMAQQIAVVTENGKTAIYQDLQEAIEKADSGSLIYLSGGSYKISDDVKITKKVSILGIGHYAKSGNADGNTLISGNLWFNENSNGSSVMGCYLTGGVEIGEDGSSVNDVVVKNCNLYRIQVHNNTCNGTVVAQNYVRYNSNLARGTLFTNNIVNSVYCECGKIYNNIFVNESGFSASFISKNIFINGQGIGSNSTNTFFDNLAKTDVGDYSANIGDLEWANLFVKYNNAIISPATDFHFVEDYESQYGKYGIYGGSGFTNQPPLPYISSKSIPEQTDPTGNLTIKIRVNSGE